MDADIIRAIQIIDAKIASLQEARNRLASAFGIGNQHPEEPPARTPSAVATSTFQAPLPASKTSGSRNSPNGQPEPSGRKVELALFLQSHGPTSRVAIVEQSKIPEGTVSYCLSDKRFFTQNSDGDWYITEYSKKGLDRRAATGSFHQGDQH